MDITRNHDPFRAMLTILNKRSARRTANKSKKVKNKNKATRTAIKGQEKIIGLQRNALTCTFTSCNYTTNDFITMGCDIPLRRHLSNCIKNLEKEAKMHECKTSQPEEALRS